MRHSLEVLDLSKAIPVKPESALSPIVSVREKGQAPQPSLASYFAVIQHRLVLIIGLALLGCFAAITVGLRQTPVYRAHASIELDGVNESYLNIHSVNPEESSSLTDAYMQTQAKLLASEMLVRRALETTSRSHSGSLKTVRTRGRLASLLQRTGLKQFNPIDSGVPDVGHVLAALAVRPIALTRVVELTYDDPDPYAAAEFMNTLLKEYISVNSERHWSATRDTEQWLTAYVAQLKGQLEHSGQSLETYARGSGLVGTSEEDTPAEAKLRELESELAKAHDERTTKQAIYETAIVSPRHDLSNSLNPSPLREYQAKLSDLRSERAQAIATLTPAHYKVRRLDAQIQEMQQLIDKEWDRTLSLIRSDYDASQRHEQLLGKSVQAQLGLIADQASKRVHYSVLRSELDADQQVYNAVLQRTKESALVAATRPTNIHVIDAAYPPPLPFAPNLSIYGFIGTLSGLFAGVLTAAFWEQRDRKLISPGVAREFAQVRELGIIPSISVDREGEFRLPFPLRKQNEIQPLLAPTSSFIFSASVHSTVASILRTECNGTQPRVLTITSARAGDGKTTLVTNLGLALAAIGRKVIVIEGDLRHPRLSKNLDVVNSWGLSDLLQSDNSLSDIPFEALVRRTSQPNLFVLPSGPSVVDVTSLLHSPRLGALLSILKQHADMVLIDSPPLLAVSDARTLGNISDAVIFAIRAHKTSKEDFLAATQELLDDRTPLLGTILNDWNPRRAPGSRDPFQYQYAYRQ